MDSKQFNNFMNGLSSAMSGNRKEPTDEDFKKMGWITLSKNNDLDNVSNFLQIDEYRYIIRGISRFHVYDSKTDKWSKLGDQDDNFKYQCGSVAINPITKNVYISDPSGDIIEFDTFDGPKAWSSKHSLKIYSSMLLLIDDELHAFGGEPPVGHKIWNINTNKTKKNKTFEKINTGFMSFGFIHCFKRKEIYILGGVDHSNGKRLDKIRRFSLETNKWEVLKTKLPQKMSGFGFDIGRDERYILISAPQSQWHSAQNNFIYIYDLDAVNHLKAIYVSHIKLPWINSRGCGTIIMDHKIENELLVFGFIRNKFKMMKKNAIPIHIVQFICNWHSIEYFHIMDDQVNHWKIHLDKILNNKSPMGMMQIM